MRTLIVIAYLLMATVAGYAQETTTTETDKKEPEMGWFYGIGMTTNPDFNINDKMLASGNHRISDVMPSVFVGWDVVWNRYTMEVEMGISGYWKKDDGYRLSQVPIAIRGKYSFMDSEKFSFAGGLGVTFVGSDLSIYSEDVVIDMNDLNPDNNSGYIRLRNGSWFVSPQVTFALGKFSSDTGRLSLGYDICVSNTQWKADYGHIANPVRENGGRFFVKFQFPL